jgi:hypothetical protein
MRKRRWRCWTRNHYAVGCLPASIGVEAAVGWAVSQAGVGCDWEAVEEGEGSIGIAGIGRVLAGMKAGRVMAMATAMESIGLDCSAAEGRTVAVWDEWELADSAVVVEEVVGYKTAAPDAQPEK